MIVNVNKITTFTTTNILRYGDYNGKVVDTKDPEKLGRIRVRVYGRTDKLEVEMLPWYLCSFPVNPSPNSQGGVPPVGSDVVVQFPDGNIYNGRVVYMAIAVPPSNNQNKS